MFNYSVLCQQLNNLLLILERNINKFHNINFPPLNRIRLYHLYSFSQKLRQKNMLFIIYIKFIKTQIMLQRFWLPVLKGNLDQTAAKSCEKWGPPPHLHLEAVFKLQPWPLVSTCEIMQPLSDTSLTQILTLTHFYGAGHSCSSVVHISEIPFAYYS